jgi:hypothetical protein
MARPRRVAEDKYRLCPPAVWWQALSPLEGVAGTKGGTAAHRAFCCAANVLDTIVVVGGAPATWLTTNADGVVVDRKVFDKTSIALAWRQHSEPPPAEGAW